VNDLAQFSRGGFSFEPGFGGEPPAGAVHFPGFSAPIQPPKSLRFPMPRKLTERQQRFVEAYLVTRNAS
jgi:hypothetical protein